MLRSRIAKGIGPAVTRIGRRKLVRTDALQAWLEACTGALRPFKLEDR